MRFSIVMLISFLLVGCGKFSIDNPNPYADYNYICCEGDDQRP